MSTRESHGLQRPNMKHFVGNIWAMQPASLAWSLALLLNTAAHRLTGIYIQPHLYIPTAMPHLYRPHTAVSLYTCIHSHAVCSGVSDSVLTLLWCERECADVEAVATLSLLDFPPPRGRSSDIGHASSGWGYGDCPVDVGVHGIHSVRNSSLSDSGNTKKC